MRSTASEDVVPSSSFQPAAGAVVAGRRGDGAAGRGGGGLLPGGGKGGPAGSGRFALELGSGGEGLGEGLPW